MKAVKSVIGIVSWILHGLDAFAAIFGNELNEKSIIKYIKNQL